MSAATKQTQTIYSIVDRINVSSVTLCVFSFLPLGTSVRLLYCCYDDHAIYTYSLSFFFRFSRRRCRPRRLTTHIYNTLFPFTSTSSFSFSLFFSRLLFKRRNSVQNCLSFFALDVHNRSSSPSLLTHIFTL